MKKLFVVLSVAGISLGSILSVRAKPIPPSKEIEFCHSMIFQNGDTKDVYASVIVNTQDYDLEKMFDRVRDEHDLMNGKPDKLTIRLYDSRDDLKAGNCKGEKVFAD